MNGVGVRNEGTPCLVRETGALTRAAFFTWPLSRARTAKNFPPKTPPTLLQESAARHNSDMSSDPPRDELTTGERE